MNENTLWAFFWMCLASVLLAITAAIGYNYHESSLIQERMITQHGIDPVILECLDTSFSTDPARYVFCLEALRKYQVNERNMTKLREIIDQE